MRAWVLLRALCTLHSAVTAIDHKHVRLVEHDARSSNLLYRSGQPLNDTTGAFAYEELIAAFRFRAEVAGIPFPTTFRLIDLSYIYSWVPSQAAKLQAEIDFYDANPSTGELIVQPIFGINSTAMQSACETLALDCTAAQLSSRQPRDFSVVNRSSLSRGFHVLDQDDTFARLKHVRALLTTPSETPLVIFGHCECGCDRTGQFFGAYNMLFHGQAFTDVMLFTNGLEWGAQTYENQVALQWFCEKLVFDGVYRHKYDCDQCLDIPCTPPESSSSRSSMAGH
jgi:hypothetical protein